MAFSAISAAFLLTITVLALLSTPISSIFSGNILNSGEKLSTGESLVFGGYSLTMQNDCNLVLYKNVVAIWSSHTDGKGFNCSLLFQVTGELVILNGTSATMWKSGTGGGFGRYALVLQYDGDVVAYGMPVWSTGTINVAK